jgi:CPA1 family monovalent cation:H+ antiporter
MHDDPVLGAIELVVGLLGALTLVALVVRRVRLPLSVALVIFGLIVAAFAPGRITVTPDLVLVALLPGLVFEAAFRLHLSDLRDVVARIAVLAVPGVLVISVVVAIVLNMATGLPLAVAFVVGAIVSATDPVAVVATMRDVAAPRRLATLVEAESLFNDGTGIVLFAIALAAASAAYDPIRGVGVFAIAIVSSLLIGAVSGLVAVRLASLVDDHLVELTLTVVVAYGTYLVANGLGQSGVIATVVAGIILGSDAAQAGMSERTRAAIDTVWEYLAFVLTAFAFLLIGFSIVLSDLAAAAGSIVWGVVAIFVGRAIVVYGMLGGLRWLAVRTTRGEPSGPAPGAARRTSWPEWGQIATMPTGWFHVLFWSGLRGAVAFALVLSLPLDVPQRGVITGTVFGIVLFTLLVQGSTAGRVIAWAGIEREPMADPEAAGLEA